MKNEIYLTIAIAFGLVCFFGCFKYYVETRKHNSLLCGVRVATEAEIFESGFNGKNQVGEDVSCHVRYMHDGREVTAERWNIGNCDTGRRIMTEYVSYDCRRLSEMAR